MVRNSQSLFPDPDISNKETHREEEKASSLTKHIADTVNASVTFAASLAVGFVICYAVITTAIILYLLKSLINLFSCRKSTSSHLSQTGTHSPFQTKPVLIRCASQYEEKIVSSPPPTVSSSLTKPDLIQFSSQQVERFLSSPTPLLSPSLTKPVLTRYLTCHEQKISSSSLQPQSVETIYHTATKDRILPESSKKTLFLGLRRVLVSFTVNPPNDGFDFVVYPVIKGKTRACYVLKRPGLVEFLHAAKNASFEIVIYTRWLSEYAGPIIDMLDPTGELITHRLYQNACTDKYGKGLFVKDLDATGRKLDRSVIIDDNPKKHVKQWSNAISVKPFHGDHSDTDLINLVNFFEVDRNFDDLRQLINVPSFSPATSILPLPSTEKKTLFLDLDQTLIYASTTQPSNGDYFINQTYFIVKRPGVQDLLRAAHLASFEIVIFTAGCAGYASPILDWLDPHNKYFAHRLYRDACSFEEGFYMKDLATTGRRLEWSVIIDDSPRRVRPQENAIAVQPFKGDSSDIELWNLLLFFEMQSRFNDIRIAGKYLNDLHNNFSNQSFLKRGKTQAVGRRKPVKSNSLCS